MSANENAGRPEGRTGDGLDAVQGIASTVPESNTSPLVVRVVDVGALAAALPEPADMGDALALECVPGPHMLALVETLRLMRGEA